MTSFYNQQRKPLTAAIIPTFNEERNVAGVLEALHLSDILDEIIVVDDGSDDKTVEIVRKFAAEDKRMHLIQNSRLQLSLRLRYQLSRYGLQRSFRYLKPLFHS